MAEWISAKDRLPEQWETVLVYTSDDRVDISVVNGGGRWAYEETGFGVTHWQSLPEPPKEVQP